MRWFKPNIRSSFYALLALVHPQAAEETVPEYSVDGIRDAMLALVNESGENEYPHVTRRIHYALDVHSLWYLRGDVMAVLAARYGESAALEKLEELTEMFEDFLPQGLRSRPSPLNSTPKND
jgi:hypothetical protein